MGTAVEGATDRIVAAARADGRDVLLETEGLDLLDGLGVRTPVRLVVSGPDEVDATALDRLPSDRVVVKVVSPQILHKTDVGGVRIVPRTVEDVRAALVAMASRLGDRDVRGWLLAECVPFDRTLGGELLLGMRATDDFGPVVTLGAGGVATEFLARHLRPGREVCVLSPALPGRARIRQAIDGLAIGPLVTGGVRGQAARIDGDTLVALLERFLAFAAERVPSDFLELEINPLVAGPDGPVALDALARLAPAPAAGAVAPEAAAPPRPLDKLARLLAPTRVAVVGVSEKPNPGHIIVKNLLREGFPAERIHLVKPGTDALLGCPCVPDLASLPEPVDLLVLAVGAAQIPALVEEAIGLRCTESMIVIPGGLGETAGSDALVARMKDALAASRRSAWRGPVVNGGNCLGVRSVPGRIDTMFIPEHKLPPATGDPAPIALISQSGALAVARASKLAGLNPRYVVSVGNQLDLTVGDYLEHLAADEAVRVFACYVEGFRPGDGRRWLEAAARLVASGRDVLLYRAGRTPAGQRASASHTASVAGDWAVMRQLARAAGVTVAESLADFEDLLLTFGRLARREARGMRLAALSNAGFECVAFADELGAFTLPALAPATVERITAVIERTRLVGIVDVHNPMDVTPMTADEPYEAVARALLDDPGVDAAVIGCVPLTGALHTLPPGPDHREDLDRPDGITERLARLFAESTKPWVAVVDGGELYDPMARRLEARGVPTFRSADRAMRALEAWSKGRL